MHIHMYTGTLNNEMIYPVGNVAISFDAQQNNFPPNHIPGGKKNPGTFDFLGLCSDQQLFFFTLLDRASFPHYNNTKIIKFG